MTRNKARKRLVRQRTAKTGESYTAALRQLRDSKESSVPTATPQTARCARCAAPDDGTTGFLFAGLPFCQACHDRLTEAVQTQLEPEAARLRRPIGWFATALVVLPDGDDGWVVHLHTLQPGLVIGREGATADRIRRSLLDVKGGGQLRLNVVPHEVFGCSAPTPP